MTYFGKRNWTRRAVIPVLAAAMISIASPAAAACLSEASARSLVNSGQVLSLGTIASRNNIQIYSAQLCERGGGYVYQLMVRGNGGNVVRMTIDARTGARI
jgi:hypothetical protein